MAANGDHHPLLAPVPAAVQPWGQTTPTRSASGSGYTPDNRMPVAIDKPSGGPVHPAKTTPAFIASGPAERLDNRRRMRAAKPSGRATDGVSKTSSGRARPCSSPVCCHQPPARAGPLNLLSLATEKRMRPVRPR